MQTKRYNPECMDRHSIVLGKEGEGNHLALRFDIAVWREAYPEAEILLWVTPPKDDGYFAALEERDGDAIWIVTQADTAHAGSGEIELILRDTKTDTTLKSETARTLTKESPSHKEGAEPPQAQKTWWERMLDMISGVVRTVNGVKPDADGNIDIEIISGGATINDNTPSTSTVYSSAKIEKELDEMDRNKADKAYMVELFAELKALILAGNTGAAIAVLDQAILDNTILA